MHTAGVDGFGAVIAALPDVVINGESGGVQEQLAARMVATGVIGKPVIALVTGEALPAGVQYGHQGAVKFAEADDPRIKKQRFAAAGVIVVDNPTEIVQAIQAIEHAGWDLDARRRDALWDNLEVIDCFATDHAPHTLAEKDSANPPPGFPGLETSLALLYEAVREDRMSMDDLLRRTVDNPRKIFGLPPQPDTWVEFDPQARWEIHASELQSRCGWTPFEGWQARGKVRQVVLRGKTAYQDGAVLAAPGSGMNLRSNN